MKILNCCFNLDSDLKLMFTSTLINRYTSRIGECVIDHKRKHETKTDIKAFD